MAVSGVEGKARKTGGTLIKCQKWELDDKAVLGESTNSETGGATERDVIKTDGTLTFQSLFNVGGDPATLGYAKGTKLSMDLRLGSSSVSYNAVPVIVESNKIVGCDSNGFVIISTMAYLNGALPALGTWGA